MLRVGSKHMDLFYCLSQIMVRVPFCCLFSTQEKNKESEDNIVLKTSSTVLLAAAAYKDETCIQ